MDGWEIKNFPQMFGVYIRELLMKRMPKQWLFSEGRKSYHHYFLLISEKTVISF